MVPGKRIRHSSQFNWLALKIRRKKERKREGKKGDKVGKIKGGRRGIKDENISSFGWLKWRDMQKICQHYHCSCIDLDLVYFENNSGMFPVVPNWSQHCNSFVGASFGYMVYTVNQNLVGFCSSDTDTHTHISMCKALNLQMFYIFSLYATFTRDKIGFSEYIIIIIFFIFNRSIIVTLTKDIEIVTNSI